MIPSKYADTCSAALLIACTCFPPSIGSTVSASVFDHVSNTPMSSGRTPSISAITVIGSGYPNAPTTSNRRFPATSSSSRSVIS